MAIEEKWTVNEGRILPIDATCDLKLLVSNVRRPTGRLYPTTTRSRMLIAAVETVS